MESWIRRLENELCDAQDEGSEFRAKLVFEGARTVVEQSLTLPQDSSPTVTCPVAIEDGNIGYLLLAIVDNEPQGVLLDTPEEGYGFESGTLSTSVIDPGAGQSLTVPRQAYHPPKELYQGSSLAQVIDQIVPQRRRASLKEEIRLSPANLELLMGIHRVLSKETHQLGLAVSDLFRRCERLKDEFRAQIYRTSQLAMRIDAVTGDDEVPDDENAVVGSARIDKRLAGVRDRQGELNAQYDRIRRKLASVGGGELSEKEGCYLEELDVMDRALEPSRRDESELDAPTWKRLHELKSLKEELKAQANDALKGGKNERDQGPSVKVPSQSRMRENEEVERLLEREIALVEEALKRLRGLGVEVPGLGTGN